ncbi:MAG: hypothetical protein J2P46_14105 [Zavarzinella sp.]|nr:hypothetical protein [Zavarzinella sp.]
MDPWFVDDDAYIQLWAWLARAPVDGSDARCPPVESRPQTSAFNPPGIYESRPTGPAPLVQRLSGALRVIEYRPIP